MQAKQKKEDKNSRCDESIIHALETYLCMYYDSMIDSSELVEAVGDLVDENNAY